MGKKTNFKDMDSLSYVKKVVSEANEAINNKKRTIATSSIPEVLGGVAGMGAGAAGSFFALYALGTTGLSAVGITSGLATAGALVGGGMVAGVGVLAAPVAVVGIAGYGFLAHRKRKLLFQAKETLLRNAIQARDAIINALKKESDENKERLDYLNSLNLMLSSAIKDLKEDLH